MTRSSVFAMVLAGSCSVASATVYQVTDLGTLPGDVGSAALGINSAGDAVGYSKRADGSVRAVAFRGGAVIDLGVLTGGGFSYGLAINDLGNVVGTSETSRGNFFTRHAFAVAKKAMIDLDKGNTTVSGATAVNNKGQAVGYSGPTANDRHATLFEAGGKVDLGTLDGDDTSIAYGINDSGVVVGESDVAAVYHPHAFRYADGVMTNLGAPYDASATAINPAGQITGWMYVDGGDAHVFRYQDGVMQDLGVIHGGKMSCYGYAINAGGKIVGECLHYGNHRAFVSQGNKLKELNKLLDPVSGAGWNIEYANGVSDDGRIVGIGNGRAVLLTPMAE